MNCDEQFEKAPDAPPALPTQPKAANFPISIVDNISLEVAEKPNDDDVYSKVSNQESFHTEKSIPNKVAHSKQNYILYLCICVTVGITVLFLLNNFSKSEYSQHKNPNSKSDGKSNVINIDKSVDVKNDYDIEYGKLKSSIIEDDFFIKMAAHREAAIQETDKSYAIYGLREGNTLNIRAGPGMEFDVIGKIPNRYAGIKIIQNDPPQSEWVLINILTKQGYVNGWVYRSYLREE